MTGGRPRRELLELLADSPPPVRQAPTPLPFEEAASEVIEWWARVAMVRARVDQLLRRHELTFSQWRVLHATEVLVRERGDLVSQLDIRQRVHMDAPLASRLMFRLGERGWLDWGPDYYDFAYRIFATKKATRMLAETRPRVVELARGARTGALGA